MSPPSPCPPHPPRTNKVVKSPLLAQLRLTPGSTFLDQADSERLFVGHSAGSRAWLAQHLEDVGQGLDASGKGRTLSLVFNDIGFEDGIVHYVVSAAVLKLDKPEALLFLVGLPHSSESDCSDGQNRGSRL